MENRSNGKFEGYKSLTVYQNAYELAFTAYRLTRKFPAEEMYGLTSQIRRAAVSIPSNISEGYRRCSRNDYIKFLRIDLEFIDGTDNEKIAQLGEQVSRLLWRLIESLRYREPAMKKDRDPPQTGIPHESAGSR
jgi:hypothetical protein